MNSFTPTMPPRKCSLVSKPAEVQIAQFKKIIGDPGKYTDSECAAAVRQIMKLRESYTVDEYANATKYVIWHPKSFTEVEFNYAAKKTIEYYDQHNQQNPRYSIQDINQAALVFVMFNLAFFDVPLENQKDFTSFFKGENKTPVITNYSDGMYSVLSTNYYQEGKYLENSARVLWDEKKFEEALNLDVNISLFILRNMGHEALAHWKENWPAYQEEHCPVVL